MVTHLHSFFRSSSHTHRDCRCHMLASPICMSIVKNTPSTTSFFSLLSLTTSTHPATVAGEEVKQALTLELNPSQDFVEDLHWLVNIPTSNYLQLCTRIQQVDPANWRNPRGFGLEPPCLSVDFTMSFCSFHAKPRPVMLWTPGTATMNRRLGGSNSVGVQNGSKTSTDMFLFFFGPASLLN